MPGRYSIKHGTHGDLPQEGYILEGETDLETVLMGQAKAGGGRHIAMCTISNPTPRTGFPERA